MSYIITEEQMVNIETWYGNSLMITSTFKTCRSHPYNPQAGREKALDTDTILNVLKTRYRKEMAILDYIEMIECEVIALRQSKGE